MLARLQRVIAFTLLLFVAVWAGICIQWGDARWAPGGLLLVLGVYLAVLGLQFLFLRASYRRGDSLAPRSSELISSWMAEALAAPRVFLWRQPFRSLSESDLSGPSFAGQRGVVLVHGFFCNRGIWNPWMKRFRAQGIPFAAVNLEPVFGPIDDYRGAIDAAVLSLHGDTGLAPIIVAHSMGGLAVRTWLATPGAIDRFHRVVTIASPHRGTRLARFGHTANGIQMRENGSWLEQLVSREDRSCWQRFVCFWSHCDNIVFPTPSATLPGADNRHLRATPHVRMVDHAEVIGAVVEIALSSSSTPRRT
ncbi:MAG: alpha/beta fold hydrolase [Caldimonas sp.]